MNERRSINTRIWTDEWFENLKPESKLVWLYLLTNPNANLIGIYEISIKRIAFDTGLNQTDVKTIIDQFQEEKKALFYHNHVIIPNWVKNQTMNANMRKSARKLFNNLPKKVRDVLSRNHFESFESLSNGSISISPRHNEPETPITPHEELKYDEATHQALCEYFGVTQLGNENHWNQSIMFIRGLENSGKLDLFKQQFEAYKEYRKLSKANWNHKFSTFIFDGWNEQNWIKNLENLKQNENTEGVNSSQKQPSRQSEAVNGVLTRMEAEDSKCS